MLDRIAGYIFGYGLVRRRATPGISELYVVRRRMFFVAIVRIDDMACGATAASIVSWVVIGAEEPKGRIKEPGFLQSEKDRIGANFSTVAANAQTILDRKSTRLNS